MQTLLKPGCGHGCESATACCTGDQHEPAPARTSAPLRVVVTPPPLPEADVECSCHGDGRRRGLIGTAG